jgi:hypothetical protein
VRAWSPSASARAAVGLAAEGRDDELVGRPAPAPRRGRARARVGLLDQAFAPRVFACSACCGVSAWMVSQLSVEATSVHFLARAQLGAKAPGRPHAAARRVAARRLDAVEELLEVAAFQHQLASRPSSVMRSGGSCGLLSECTSKRRSHACSRQGWS